MKIYLNLMKRNIIKCLTFPVFYFLLVIAVISGKVNEIAESFLCDILNEK